MFRHIRASASKTPTATRGTERPSPTAATSERAPARNQAIQRMLRSAQIQTKLNVSQPSDSQEVEADQIADKVMRMSEPTIEKYGLHIQRMCSQCEHDTERERFRKNSDQYGILRQSVPSSQRWSGATSPVTSGKLAGLNGGGSALPESMRTFFEPRFGRDFGDVRIHTGPQAHQSTRAIDAKAYTYGRNIVFGAEQFSPNSDAGRKLLAHELAHTAQQVGDVPGSIQRTIGDGHDLQAPRFAGNVQLEAAFDNELLIQEGSPHHTAVRLIQQSLLDMGYTLPGFGVDGIFGPETKAAVIRFQTDAGAVLKDGIVGPETMGLFDQHDTSLLTGAGPVAITGPVPAPRPAPAPSCAGSFTGVTFTLANQVATGVNPAARIGIGRSGGRDALVMQGTAPANYNPDVTINAPSNAKAQEFQVGFISNLLTDLNEYVFSNGARIHAVLPTPMKDGVALSSGQYDPVYVTQPSPHILETFTGNGATVHLNWPDTPSDTAFVNLLDNPQCGAPLTAGTMTRNRMRDTFRTWVAVRHMATGCVVPLHHIDWDLDWSSAVLNLGPFGFTAVATGSAINVTQPNGDGKPSFIQGGQVPDDFVAARTDRVCT